MEKPLALQHLHIGNSGELRIFLQSLLDGACLIYFCLIRCQAAGKFPNVGRHSESGKSDCLLIVMLFDIINRLAHHHQVECLGEGCVLCSRPCHVDNAFLEADNASRCHYSHALECVCLSASHCVYLGDHSREYASSSFHFYSGLDHVLHRCDADRLARAGNVKRHSLDLLIFQSCLFQLLLCYIKDTVLNFALIRKLDILDVNVAHF